MTPAARCCRSSLVQLRRLDLSGAAACCDADLAPLSQLSSLTALSLEGLWQVTVSTLSLLFAACSFCKCGLRFAASCLFACGDRSQ